MPICDDAPLEERRARAVEMRRTFPPDLAGQLGALDPQAIAEVAAEVWPVVRDADELHDALLTLVWAPEAQVQAWAQWLTALTASGRAAVVTIHDGPDGARVNGWVATERAAALDTVFPACGLGAIAHAYAQGCFTYARRIHRVDCPRMDGEHRPHHGGGARGPASSGPWRCGRCPPEIGIPGSPCFAVDLPPPPMVQRQSNGVIDDCWLASIV